MANFTSDPDCPSRPTGNNHTDSCGCQWEEWTDGTNEWEIKVYDCGTHLDSGGYE